VVARPAFREFTQLLDPRLVVLFALLHFCFLTLSFFRFRSLSRKTVSEKIVAGLPQVKKEITQVLKDSPSRISCTTDGWTSEAKESYIVVTAHFIDHAWKMQGLIIAFEHMPESHTGQHLCNRLVRVAKDFGIEGKISCIISDNANSAMSGITLATKAMSTASNTVIPLRCLAHIINLVVGEGFKTLAEPLKTLKAMTTFLRASNTALSSLKGFCQGNKEKYRKPQIDSKTRWNSTLVMITSLNGMRKSLDQLKHTKIVDEGLTEDDWAQLELFINLLKPFKGATGSSYCTLSIAGRVVRKLWEHLNDSVEAVKGVGVLQMIEKLQKYWEDVQDQSFLPSFFDPRTLPLLMKNANDRHVTLAAVKKLLKKPSIPTKPKEESFLDTLDDDEEEEDKDTEGFPELREYSQINGIHKNEDPLKWWAENEQRFPTIAILARDSLGMLASTVPSEEAFSAAGNTITKKRSRLKPKTVEALIVSQSWRRYLRKLQPQQQEDQGEDQGEYKEGEEDEEIRE